MARVNHYKYLEKHLNSFWIKSRGKSLEEDGCAGIIGAHGDKTRQYTNEWSENGINLSHGTAIYFLSYTDSMDRPKHESCEFVIDNYEKYKNMLTPVDEFDDDILSKF